MTCQSPPPCPPYPPFPPFPANPATGQRFGSWVWNGTQWVISPATGLLINTQVFRASGTYTPSPNLVTAVVSTIGGGGAGGSAGGAPTNLWILGGGGGGSGGYSRITLAGALVLGGVAVTVGAGGAQNDMNIPGGNGGDTSFGAFCVAHGGKGGQWNAVGQSTNGWGEGGAGGDPGTGDLTFPGDGGLWGVYINLTAASQQNYGGGKGGSIMGGTFSLAFGPNQIPGGFSSAANTGGGGSGAVLNQLATGAISQGGAGGSGICWVDETCMAAPSSNWPMPCPPPGQAAISGCGPGWGDFDCGPPGVWPQR